MKIIFDTEEQKEKFITAVVRNYCPRLFGDFPNQDDASCDEYDTCEDCWARCGIEIEVNDNENHI